MVAGGVVCLAGWQRTYVTDPQAAHPGTPASPTRTQEWFVWCLLIRLQVDVCSRFLRSLLPRLSSDKTFQGKDLGAPDSPYTDKYICGNIHLFALQNVSIEEKKTTWAPILNILTDRKKCILIKMAR